MAANGRLGGTVAWITGGGSGIGAATAAALAEEGACVALSGRRADELERVAAGLRERGLAAHAHPLDVADAQAAARCAEAIAAAHGPIGLLVCSAGVNVPGRFWDRLDAASFDRVVGINLSGVAHCVLPVLPGMRAAGGGTIAIVSSWAGRHYMAFTGAAYSASKAALGPLVESLNAEQGPHGIRASLVMPGEVATPILRNRPVPPSDEEMARMLRPEDVAEVVRHLATAPSRVCLAEVLIAPTWNRAYLGGEDLVRR
jgi:NADP-dependent 3-hydroxy acid dehydrogenase YdfG